MAGEYCFVATVVSICFFSPWLFALAAAISDSGISNERRDVCVP